MKIQSINGFEILDSRGNPTVETHVWLENGSEGWAMVPAGASTGTFEAQELRDHDLKRYGGQGVLQAVSHVNQEIAGAVVGLDAEDQHHVDTVMLELDGTDNKHHMGANALLSVSLAVARAEAVAEKKPLYQYLSELTTHPQDHYILPLPFMNVMNGGRHANWATDIQEYMITPIGAATIQEGIAMNVAVYHQLKGILESKSYATTVGDEGGYAPAVSSNEEPFQLLINAIEKAGYIPGKDIAFAIDPAASEFYKNGCYSLKRSGSNLTSTALADMYRKLAEMYPIISMEDTFHEEDWDTFQAFTAQMGSKLQIVGDDLYVTNKKRLQKGIEQKSTNAILIKPNQIGTLSETIATVTLAQENHIACMMSHRSGETEDSFIADLAVGLRIGQMKSGAPARSERTAKYNRLMKIEQELGDRASLAQFSFIR